MAIPVDKLVAVRGLLDQIEAMGIRVELSNG
jgi:hypothetical protein